MGYRTVVVLSNDLQHEWSKDPQLGAKIARAQHAYRAHDNEFDTGAVIECVHADQQTLMVVENLTAYPICHSNWSQHQDRDAVNLKLVREAAERLGYVLHKKPVRA